MKTLKFPEGFDAPLDVVRSALKKEHTLTVEQERALVGLFAAYEAASGRGDVISPSPFFQGEMGTILTDAYSLTYSRKALKRIRKDLLALAGHRCPRCGGCRPGTLDHHLPESTYAEFAMYLKNLVPSCHRCNSKKGAEVGSRPEEAFLHPYFDEVPETQFIKVELVTGRGYAVRLSFDEDAPIGDAVLKARIAYQFRKIDVPGSLQSEMPEYLCEVAGQIRDRAQKPSIANVRRFLRVRATSADQQYGPGSWQSAVLRHLASSQEFCEGGYRKLLPVPAGTT